MWEFALRCIRAGWPTITIPLVPFSVPLLSAVWNVSTLLPGTVQGGGRRGLLGDAALGGSGRGHRRLGGIAESFHEPSNRLDGRDHPATYAGGFQADASDPFCAPPPERRRAGRTPPCIAWEVLRRLAKVDEVFAEKVGH